MGALAIIAAAFAAGLTAAPPAGAHAELLRTDPADGAVLPTAPDSVLLTFSEPVETAFGSVRVYDSNAERVDRGDETRPHPDEVSVGLPGSLPDGTYTVSWRVVSEDSHPISGAFVFSVGDEPPDAGVAAQVADTSAPGSVDVAQDVVRFARLAALVALGGLAVVLALVLGQGHDALRRRLRHWLAGASLVFAVACFAGLVVQGADAGGFSLGEAIDADVVSEVLDTRFGRVWAVAGAYAIVLAVLALFGSDRLCLALAAALALAPPAAGHAGAEGTLAMISDTVHVAAASTWVGGLAAVGLALVLAGAGGRWSLAGHVVPRFSTLALWAVVGVLASGTLNALLHLEALSDLVDTRWGQLVLIKIGLVGGMLAFGLINRRYVVPGVRSGAAAPRTQRLLTQTFGVEIALGVAVLIATSVLVGQPPPSASAAAQNLPATATAPLGEGLEMNVVVDPAVAGTNAIHLYLTDRNGRPAKVAEATVEASLPADDIGPLDLRTIPAGPGHYVVTRALLTAPGDWKLDVKARRGDFEALSGTVTIPIREAPST